ISLGGHGVIFSSLLNDHNSYRGKKLYQSFTAICPVINLKDTVNQLSQPGPRGAVVDFWASLRLEGLREKTEAFQNHRWFDLIRFRTVFLPRVFQFIEQQFLTRPPRLGPIRLPATMKEAKDFWQANNFLEHYRNVESPLLVLATAKDDFV